MTRNKNVFGGKAALYVAVVSGSFLLSHHSWAEDQPQINIFGPVDTSPAKERSKNGQPIPVGDESVEKARKEAEEKKAKEAEEAKKAQAEEERKAAEAAEKAKAEQERKAAEAAEKAKAEEERLAAEAAKKAKAEEESLAAEAKKKAKAEEDRRAEEDRKAAQAMRAQAEKEREEAAAKAKAEQARKAAEESEKNAKVEAERKNAEAAEKAKAEEERKAAEAEKERQSIEEAVKQKAEEDRKAAEDKEARKTKSDKTRASKTTHTKKEQTVTPEQSEDKIVAFGRKTKNSKGSAEKHAKEKSKDTYDEFFKSDQYKIWKSAYVGGQVGISSGDESGVSLGGFVGHNWQSGRVVYGVEAEASINSGSDSRTVGLSVFSTDPNWSAAVRGRLGYLVQPDLMVYGTAGIAIANHDVKLQGPTSSISQSETSTGFLIGAGIEKQFDENWSARVEYVYVNYDDVTVSNGQDTATYDPDSHTIRIAVAYRF